MTIYTVHAPPPKVDETATSPDRFVFVRDGFYFWAFVFGPLWLLFKRLWLALLLYIATVAVLQTVLWLIGVPRPTHGVVSLLMHLLIGLEASSLHRWTLQRRDWRQLGVVAGTNDQDAERRFFDTWVAQRSMLQTPAAPPPPNPQNMRAPPDASDIIGLFPEPQSRQ